ncbi:hypothetical protein C8F00_3617 [Xanthomonas vasicola]
MRLMTALQQRHAQGGGDCIQSPHSMDFHARHRSVDARVSARVRQT